MDSTVYDYLGFNSYPNLKRFDATDILNEPNFSNTESWVKNAFRTWYNSCWGPNFGGYQLKKIENIVQRTAPSPTQSEPNENTYQWDIRYIYIEPDGVTEAPWCQTFFYKTTGEYTGYTHSKWDKPSCKHYYSMGHWGNCLAQEGSGFHPLGEGESAADAWVLKKSLACPNKSTNYPITKTYYNAGTNQWKVEIFDCEPYNDIPISTNFYDTEDMANDATSEEWTKIAMVYGCTDVKAINYNPKATLNDGSCESYIEGCTDSNATNYNPDATYDDKSCIFPILGCTDDNAKNYNPEATEDDASCEYIIKGCIDPEFKNYNPNATEDDGSCSDTISDDDDDDDVGFNINDLPNWALPLGGVTLLGIILLSMKK